MAKIVSKLSLVLLGLFLFNFFVYHNSAFYKRRKSYLKRISEVAEDKPSILFLGDSHAGVRRVSLAENVASLASGADGPKEMYLKTKRVLEVNPNLQTTFVIAEPQIFNNSVSPNMYFTGELANKTNESSLYGESQLDNILSFIPMFNEGYISFFKRTLFKKSNSQATNWAKLPEKERIERSQRSGITDHKGIFANKDTRIYYTKTIELLKGAGVKIIGIQYPVNSQYYAQCADDDLRNVKSFIDSLSFDLVLDYTNLLQDPTYFLNEDHPNKKGLSILLQEIKKDTGLQIKAWE